MLLVELCLCIQFSNATLERFFSHLKVVKTQLRSMVSAESSNSIMRIRLKGLGSEEFNQDYASKCADFGIIPRHAILININKKNIQNENPTNEKEENSISMNLEVKVAHVLAKKSVKYNVRIIYHCLYTNKLFYSAF